MSISQEERDVQVDLLTGATSAGLAAGQEYRRHSRRDDLEEIVSYCDTATKAAEKLEAWNG